MNVAIATLRSALSSAPYSAAALSIQRRVHFFAPLFPQVSCFSGRCSGREKRKVCAIRVGGRWRGQGHTGFLLFDAIKKDEAKNRYVDCVDGGVLLTTSSIVSAEFTGARDREWTEGMRNASWPPSLVTNFLLLNRNLWFSFLFLERSCVFGMLQLFFFFFFLSTT